MVLCLLCLTPLSTIVQLYRGGQYYWWRTMKYPERTTGLSHATDKLNHLIQYLNFYIFWRRLSQCEIAPIKKFNIEYKWFYFLLNFAFFININVLWVKEEVNLYKREVNTLIVCVFLMNDFRLVWTVVIWNRCGIDQIFLLMTSYIWYIIYLWHKSLIYMSYVHTCSITQCTSSNDCHVKYRK